MDLDKILSDVKGQVSSLNAPLDISDEQKKMIEDAAAQFATSLFANFQSIIDAIGKYPNEVLAELENHSIVTTGSVG